MKKILSSVLCAVMIFMTVVVLIPTKANAAYSPSTSTASASLSKGAIAALFGESKEGIADAEDVKNIYSYTYETARELLDYEMGCNYISSITIGNYALHINKYTGFVYYENTLTGQILTSNPTSYNTTVPDDDNTSYAQATSQIFIEYIETAKSGSDEALKQMASSLSAGKNGQISLTFITNGIRVNYTLGDTSSRLLPVAMEAEKFEELILKPMIEKLEEKLLEYNPDLQPLEYQFFAEGAKWPDEMFYAGGEVDLSPISEASGLINSSALAGYLAKMDEIIAEAYVDGYEGYDELVDLSNGIYQLVCGNVYNLYDPLYWIDVYNNTDDDFTKEFAEGKLADSTTGMFNKYPITGKMEGGTPVAGKPIYVIVADRDKTDDIIDYEKQYTTQAKKLSDLLLKYSNYALLNIIEDETEVGYSGGTTVKPVFRCALEYKLNSNGTLTVSLPASSISFDESVYTLRSIKPLMYFGAGTTNGSYDSYALFPDGSGMICDFSDYGKDINNARSLYGTDYAYSELNTYFEYQEQVAMPVYGVVTEVPSNDLTAPEGTTVMNGYFAIIEDGSALGTLEMFSSNTDKANIYVSYAPYPTDTFQLDEEKGYQLTLGSKYSGAFVTNITMLTDPELAATKNIADAYLSDYNGMAQRYRDYLRANGTLEKLENIESDNIPLYIETLGAIEVVEKYLTFPVNVNIPLTTFDNVLTMYNELANVKQTLQSMADEYHQKASETSNEEHDLKEFYNKKAAEYEALKNKVQDGIKNVNFRLTGFANDGMNKEYPTKVKWEKACGGKGGFAELTAEAKRISEASDANFGVYPEFDFMFLEKDGAFNGVKRWDKARMIDNRYASKQIYNPSDCKYYQGYGSIINTASLEKLFGKFEDSYSKYDWKYVSLSTFGSALNSNLNREDPVSRDMSISYITDVLDSATTKEYSIMVDKGNAYTYEYVDHILNLSIDSSHHSYCSYTVPFVGMVLHGSINYAGTPINYSGSAEYDVLKSIENGASLYYILCYQNTSLMKDSDIVNNYYSVNYETWFERMVDTYTTLNKAIGDLQDYTIIEHKNLIAEKYLDTATQDANAEKIKAKFIDLIDRYLRSAINIKLKELKDDDAIVDKSIELTVDVDALCDQLKAVTSLPDRYIDDIFKDEINAVVASVEDYFGITAGGQNAVAFNAVPEEGVSEYTSEYDCFTNSFAEDKDYDKTFCSVANNNVVMVTYAKYDQEGNITDTVSFVLNYNIDKVTVNLEGQSEPIILGKYDFQRIG